MPGYARACYLGRIVTGGDPIARVPVRASDLSTRELDGQLYLLTFRDRVLRSLNPLGARAWELMDGRRSAGEIVQALLEEYEVDLPRVRDDVLQFIAELERSGLVTLRDP